MKVQWLIAALLLIDINVQSQEMSKELQKRLSGINEKIHNLKPQFDTNKVVYHFDRSKYKQRGNTISAKFLKNNNQSLTPMMVYLSLEAATRTQWELAFVNGDYSERPIAAERAVDCIVNWARNYELSNDRKKYTAEDYYIYKYQDNLGLLFNAMNVVGNKLGEFFYNDTIAPPVAFARKENSMVLLIRGISDETVFNTLRTTAKQRAWEIIQSRILPTIREINDSFYGVNEIRCVGMCVFYGSKDFMAEQSTKPEAVAVILPLKMCHKFVSGELSQEDLLDSSDIYLSDRDMLIGFKKVKISTD